MSKLIPLLIFLLAGCFGPGNLQSRHSTDLESRRIRRIVILPALETAGSQVKVAPTPGEPKSPERDPNDTLARLIYQVMSGLPNWQIVSESEAREVSQTITASNEAARLRELGEAVYADAVLIGRVRRFRERVGDEWGVKSPASVAFRVGSHRCAARRRDLVGSFDETQKSLSENIFAIGDIISERGVRWLTAEQLAHEGVKKGVAQLHQLIARAAIS